MTPQFPYVQLPGTFRGFFRKASLWEGIDHILSVSGTRFNDEYRRFYYRDIQAFIVEKRPRAGSWGWWCILLIALIVSGTVSTQTANALYFFAALLVVFLIRLEFTFRRSCRCSIQTAVSREFLPSLIRKKDADQAIQRLQMRVAAVQGDLPFEIPSATDEVSRFVIPPDPSQQSAQEMLQDAAVKESRQAAIRGVNWAVLTFFVLLFNSVYVFWVSSGNRLSFQISSAAVGYVLITLSLIPAFVGLQNLGGLKATKSLRAVLISVIALGVLRFVVSWSIVRISMLVVSTRGIGFIPVFNRYYTNINGGLQLALAAGGLILIFAKWEEYRRGEASSD